MKIFSFLNSGETVDAKASWNTPGSSANCKSFSLMALFVFTMYKYLFANG